MGSRVGWTYFLANGISPFRTKVAQTLINLKNDPNHCFESKAESFYKRGIQSLPERREKVVAVNKDHFNVEYSSTFLLLS